MVGTEWGLGGPSDPEDIQKTASGEAGDATHGTEVTVCAAEPWACSTRASQGLHWQGSGPVGLFLGLLMTAGETGGE